MLWCSGLCRSGIFDLALKVVGRHALYWMTHTVGMVRKVCENGHGGPCEEEGMRSCVPELSRGLRCRERGGLFFRTAPAAEGDRRIHRDGSVVEAKEQGQGEVGVGDSVSDTCMVAAA